uniref:Uncharacterized protein n=1 Tax=Rhizophora mucronata TaxID=61149 RepID=A0A2P2JJM0_RHIMU
MQVNSLPRNLVTKIYSTSPFH